jgi:hypothetical protein
MKAQVESRWDDGAPLTLRDEEGGLWRVEIDAADGTLAVAEISDHGGGPAIHDAETVGMVPCGIAWWCGDDELEIRRVSSHGENHTDPSTYGVGYLGEFIATPSGWEALVE